MPAEPYSHSWRLGQLGLYYNKFDYYHLGGDHDRLGQL
jgi:hypothetical protein